MVAGSIPVRRSWTSLPGGLFLHHFEGGRLPLAPAALSAKHSGCHPREGGDLFCASKPSSATPSAGSSPQRPRPRSTNRCHARLRAGTSSFSSKRMVQQNVMLTIADCHADENQHRMFFEKYVCFEWHFARKHDHFVRVLCADRSRYAPVRHSGMRSLSPPRLVNTRRLWLTAKRLLSAKKHERGSGM